MFKRIRIVGEGRVGSAAKARLSAERLEIVTDAPELVLVCVPDAAIPEVAGTIPEGPWIAHVSGATPLAALAPHARRFGVHPLQTFDRSGSPGQFAGAWAAVTAESVPARDRARWLAVQLGMHPFDLDERSRTLYHAGAVIASNYLVTLYRSARLLLEQAGAPPEALLPLMRRTIDNGFDLTGPIARGDWRTVDAHLAAIHEAVPQVESLYRAMAEATRP